MLTISKPPVGAIAFGRSGVGYIITALEADRVILRTPDGLKRVPLNAIIRWERPSIPDSLKPAQHGAVWDEAECQWLEPEWLGLLSMADLTGIPDVKQCRQGFGRYVALTADGLFIRCTKKDPSYEVLISRLVPFDQVPLCPTTPGQRVRHKQTQHEFTVVELYKVRCDRDEDDEPFMEQWARLRTTDGKPATWKLSQLEAVP